MRFLKTSLCIATILPLALFTGMALASEDAERLEILGIKPAASVSPAREEADAEPAAEAPPAPQADNEKETTAAGDAHHPVEAATAKETEEQSPHHGMAEMEMAPRQQAKTESDHHDQEAAGHGKKAAHHDTVHWGYEGAGAPHYWGDLKAEFATCKSGRSQSPIDISAVVVTSLPAIDIDYQNTTLNVVNNGHTIQVNYQAGSSINVGGKRFHLLQFHFHSPSEHTIGGKAYPMVAHLVHKADDGQLGVIGIMIKEGRPNPLLARLWAHMPEAAGSSITVEGESINVGDLLPKDLTYFNYSGSLTTPPCTEGVHWMVLAVPVEASAEQIARFRALYPNDARPVQPVNGRIIRLAN